MRSNFTFLASRGNTAFRPVLSARFTPNRKRDPQLCRVFRLYSDSPLSTTSFHPGNLNKRSGSILLSLFTETRKVAQKSDCTPLAEGKQCTCSAARSRGLIGESAMMSRRSFMAGISAACLASWQRLHATIGGPGEVVVGRPESAAAVPATSARIGNFYNRAASRRTIRLSCAEKEFRCG